MDLIAHEDTKNQDLHLHVTVSAVAREFARHNVERMVIDQMVHELTAALRPEFETQVRARIDWARITRAVEDVIITRQADLLLGDAERRRR